VERSIPVVSLDKAFERSAALGYYAAMASAAAVAALLATVAGFAADHRALLPDLLARVAVFLGVVNLAGAALVFAPIRRLLGGDSATRDAAARRISALSAASGLWIGALAAAAMLGHSAAVHSSWGALLQSSPRVLAGTLLHVAGFGVYLGLYAYFVTLDYSMRLRERLWRSGERFPARGGKLVYRLVAALIAVAAAPLLIVLSDQWTQAAAQMPMGAAMRHGAFMRQTLQMDLLAALVLVGVVIWLVVRGLARPVDVLLGRCIASNAMTCASGRRSSRTTSSGCSPSGSTACSPGWRSAIASGAPSRASCRRASPQGCSRTKARSSRRSARPPCCSLTSRTSPPSPLGSRRARWCRC
jgi:hypothetical protein